MATVHLLPYPKRKILKYKMARVVSVRASRRSYPPYHPIWRCKLTCGHANYVDARKGSRPKRLRCARCMVAARLEELYLRKGPKGLVGPDGTVSRYVPRATA